MFSDKNIYITGFMGSGKTTVAKVLADKLNLKFVDTDELIENKVGKNITDIFESNGEEYFREIESEILAKVCSGAGAVVNVNEEDAEIMLAKRGGQCCPGSVGPQPYFAKDG